MAQYPCRCASQRSTSKEKPTVRSQPNHSRGGIRQTLFRQAACSAQDHKACSPATSLLADTSKHCDGEGAGGREQWSTGDTSVDRTARLLNGARSEDAIVPLALKHDAVLDELAPPMHVACSPLAHVRGALLRIDQATRPVRPSLFVQPPSVLQSFFCFRSHGARSLV